MFVKKDLRKIPEILDQAKKPAVPPSTKGEIGANCTKEPRAGEVLTELRLARRSAEFGGTLSVLCQPQYMPTLRNLVSLNLYDCRIRTLDGIGMLGSPSSSPVDGAVPSPVCPDLRELNVGRNPLRSLPDELSSLSGSLKTLWCDDCSIEGSLPECVLRLGKLEALRMSNNAITAIPNDIHRLSELRVLCMDGNKIDEIPPSLSKMGRLELLNLRKNGIVRLPEGVPGLGMTSLRILHVSSNKLVALPNSLTECTSLETIYANTNQVQDVLEGLASKLMRLKKMNLSTNKIEFLSEDFLVRFGEPDCKSGFCQKDDACEVNIDQNPVVERTSSLQMSQEKTSMVNAEPTPMDICA